MQMVEVKLIQEILCRVQVWGNFRTIEHPEHQETRFMHLEHCVIWHLRGFYIGEVAAIRAIPKKLLIHSVVLYQNVEKDRWGKENPGEGMFVEKVRLEPTSKVIRDKNNAEVQLAAVMFYDCKNSSPKELSFKTDEIIVFNGQRHQIKTIEPMYDGKKLHHYELGLIKHA